MDQDLATGILAAIAALAVIVVSISIFARARRRAEARRRERRDRDLQALIARQPRATRDRLSMPPVGRTFPSSAVAQASSSAPAHDDGAAQLLLLHQSSLAFQAQSASDHAGHAPSSPAVESPVESPVVESCAPSSYDAGYGGDSYGGGGFDSGGGGGCDL